MVDTLDLQFPPPPSGDGAAFAPGYPIRIESDVPRLGTPLREIFGAFEVEDAQSPETTYQVRPARPREKGFRLRVGGKNVSVHRERHRLLFELEWLIVNEVVFNPNPYFLIHAALVSREGRTVLLPGSRRSGKTTLALGLVLRGWRYLSDDISPICPDTLMAVPFPRNFYVRKDVRPLLAADSRREGNGPRVRPRKPIKEFVSPNRLWEGSLGGPSRVTHIFFPAYRPGATPAIAPLGPAAAVSRLAAHSWGIYLFGKKGVEILADLVGGAECGELTAGPVEETCALVEDACGLGRGGLRP
ncbi:MAG: hypothetical protein ACE5IM_11165 [Nitrospinota bacterium]